MRETTLEIHRHNGVIVNIAEPKPVYASTAGLIGADGSYLGGAAYASAAVVQPATTTLTFPRAVYVEPEAHTPEDDARCAFWSMVFSFICCVGCISFCINCGAPQGSKRLRFARIGCAISCIVGEHT